MSLKKTIVSEPLSPFSKATYFLLKKEITVENTICFMSQVNLTQIENLRSKMTKKPSYTAFVVKALAIAMHEYPYVNRRIYHLPLLSFLSRVQIFTQVDICVAAERFLPNEFAAVFADVLRSPDQMSLDAITDWLNLLANADLDSNQQWADYYKLITKYPFWIGPFLVHVPFYFKQLWLKYRGGSAMISSPSKYGVDQLVGWWTHPIGVSFGYAEKRAVVIDDKIEIAKTFFLSLNWDRRLMGGAQAAQFFNRIIELLENAETELTKISPALPHAEKQNEVSFLWKTLEKIFKVGKR